ncbi:MAG TPA: hypothetical protein VLI39_07685 [Sedimentisphaerales bacterium]|nr:hypothetical protein [Sedimentisphaerales bacterium]
MSPNDIGSRGEYQFADEELTCLACGHRSTTEADAEAHFEKFHLKDFLKDAEIVAEIITDAEVERARDLVQRRRRQVLSN